MTRKLMLAALAAGIAFPAHAATEIQWWHALTGAGAEKVNQLAEQFNGMQSDYKIVVTYKGSYPETLNAGIAAFRAKQQPHILQVFDVGTGSMMASKGAYVPVEDVMKSAGAKFDAKDYLPGITAYYSTAEGKLVSFPFNSSSPILYYNKDLFKKAGLDENKPPKTWPELFEAARKIKASGHGCGYTSTWMTWIQLENFSAWNNVSYATKQNGLAGMDAELKFNSPLHVKQWQSLADLSKDGTFQYGGRTSEAKNKFLSGECAILTESSGGLGDVVKSKIPYGIGNLPYWPESQGAPQNTVPGGASLWVLAGHPEAHYKGVGKFFEFLSQTDTQVGLHQVTGYLPVTFAAYEATKASGFYEKNPGRETPIQQMTGKAPTENSKGIRLGGLVQIRTAIDEEAEAMFAGKQDAKTALDNAVKRGNEAVKQALGQ